MTVMRMTHKIPATCETMIDDYKVNYANKVFMDMTPPFQEIMSLSNRYQDT